MSRSILVALAIALGGPSLLAAQSDQNVDLKEWPIERGGLSRDPYVGPDGKVWFTLRFVHKVAVLDPTTGTYTTIDVGRSPHGIFLNAQAVPK